MRLRTFSCPPLLHPLDFAKGPFRLHFYHAKPHTQQAHPLTFGPARFDAGVVSGAFYKLVRCSDVDSCAEVLKLLKPELEWLEGQMDETGGWGGA